MARLLAVNWRDLRNPEAGGAEVHLHEILTRMVDRGHQVTMFATRFPGSSETDSYDGIHVIRRGNWYDANYVIPWHVRSYLQRHPADLIIEDVNKIPFFLPMVTKTRVLPVIPHLFGTTVFRETNFLFASYVYFWELLIPRVYRDCRFAVISPSTKQDLVERGVPGDHIDVVLCGLDHATYRRLDSVQRRTVPTIVHFGRIRKYKAVDVVIRAFVHIKAKLPDAELLIIGDGPGKPSLVKYAKKMVSDDSIKFLGVVKTEDMIRILNEAHVFLNASPKEGWGLTVVEANACGLPVIAADSPGLRDSVLDEKSGYLVTQDDDHAFAEKSLELLSDKERWSQMSAAAMEWAGTLTWERTADEMEKIFLEEIGKDKG